MTQVLSLYETTDVPTGTVIGNASLEWGTLVAYFFTPEDIRRTVHRMRTVAEATEGAMESLGAGATLCAEYDLEPLKATIFEPWAQGEEWEEALAREVQNYNVGAEGCSPDLGTFFFLPAHLDIRTPRFRGPDRTRYYAASFIAEFFGKYDDVTVDGPGPDQIETLRKLINRR